MVIINKRSLLSSNNHNCLDIIAVKGAAAKLTGLADKLVAHQRHPSL